MPLHHPGALHEHAARPTGRIPYSSSRGLDHVGDQGDQGNRGEELTAVVGLLVGELGQEVFVDAAEDITGNPLELLGVEGAQQLPEHSVVELLILALGQHAAQILVVGLDGLHGVYDRLGPVGAVRQCHQSVELGLGLEEDGALLAEIFLGQRSGLAATCGQGRLDVVFDGEIAAVSVA